MPVGPCIPDLPGQSPPSQQPGVAATSPQQPHRHPSHCPRHQASERGRTCPGPGLLPEATAGKKDPGPGKNALKVSSWASAMLVYYRSPCILSADVL